MKFYFAASTLCEPFSDYLQFTNWQHLIPAETMMTFAEKAKRYFLDFNQPSFCYEKQKFVELSHILTVDGLCFGFNVAENMLDRTV